MVTTVCLLVFRLSGLLSVRELCGEQAGGRAALTAQGHTTVRQIQTDRHKHIYECAGIDRYIYRIASPVPAVGRESLTSGRRAGRAKSKVPPGKTRAVALFKLGRAPSESERLDAAPRWLAVNEPERASRHYRRHHQTITSLFSNARPVHTRTPPLARPLWSDSRAGASPREATHIPPLTLEFVAPSFLLATTTKLTAATFQATHRDRGRVKRGRRQMGSTRTRDRPAHRAGPLARSWRRRRRLLRESRPSSQFQAPLGARPKLIKSLASCRRRRCRAHTPRSRSRSCVSEQPAPPNKHPRNHQCRYPFLSIPSAAGRPARSPARPLSVLEWCVGATDRAQAAEARQNVFRAEGSSQTISIRRRRPPRC
jgi:hypothetical protein